MEEAALLAARRHLRAAPAPAPPSPAGGGGGGAELRTVFVEGVAFLRPSTVGDRVVMRAQCTRAFGPLVEVEVRVEPLAR